jgi:hypothetical protein
MRIGMGCKAQFAAKGWCHWQELQRSRAPKPRFARPRGDFEQALRVSPIAALRLAPKEDFTLNAQR